MLSGASISVYPAVPGVFNTYHILHITGSAGTGFSGQDIVFNTLIIDPGVTFTFGGLFLGPQIISTDSGSILLEDWLTYDPAGGDLSWTFNPSVAGSTVTMVFSGMAASTSYDLLRDGSTISSAMSDGGIVTFVVTGGWSSHLMDIVPTPPPPTGGPCTGPGCTPITPPPGPGVFPPFMSLSPLAVSLYILVAGILAFLSTQTRMLLGATRYARGLKMLGMILIAAGLVGLLVFAP